MERIAFPTDGSEQWLEWVDLALALHLLRGAGVPEACEVLEIGVWKGAWSSSILVNLPAARVTGVDPYPEGAWPVRARMLDRMEELGVAGRFTLLRSTAEVEPSARFDLIHIDGDHSEASVSDDLELAMRRLTPRGVIIVDDISHKWLPAVASATYRFLERSGARMFMITRSKAYIAGAERAAELHAELQRTLTALPGVRAARSFAELTGHPYPEASDVLDQPVLLVIGPKTDPTAPTAGRRQAGLATLRRLVARIRRRRLALG